MYCFKLIVLLFVQNAIKPTSYLFVRIPNLLCMLKYGNVEMEVPAGTDHFEDRVWESAKPETGAHLPPPPAASPAGAASRESGHRLVPIPLLTGRSLLFSASEAANVLTRFRAPSSSWRERKGCAVSLKK